MTRILCLLLLPIVCLAQKTVILSGYVQDAKTGEKLPGATLYFPVTKQGITANKYGFFSLKVTAKPVELEVSHVGYIKKNVIMQVDKDSLTVFHIFAYSANLEEVIVKAEQSTKDTYLESTMGRYHMSVETVNRTPALLGESDLLKTLQLLPGVQAGSEGTIGLNVRGGTPDQNLVLLDGIPVYNINHLFGFLSVINSDAISSAEFLKGSMPARYGGRLSSVLDIRLREGNMKEWKSSLSFSPITSKLTVEGPLVKNKSSVFLSVRRTWLDALLALGQRVSKANGLNTIGFYDINAKWNYTFSPKDRLFFSYYTGRDKLQNSFKLSEATYSYGFNWGNQTFGLRWNHLYSQKLFGNLLINYTNFSYNLEDRFNAKNNFVNKVSSGIRDIGIRYDFDYFPANNHVIKYGIGAIQHSFKPEIKQFKTTATDTTTAPSNRIGTFETYSYMEDDITFSKSIKGNIGFHYANQFVNSRTYHSLQPRLSIRFTVGKTASLKASYNRTTQFLHLLTNSSAGLPTDLWVPVTSKIPPERADSYAVGYSAETNKGFSVSIEAYYKKLHNVLEYKEGTNFLNNPSLNWEDRVSIGKARSFGAEFFIEKTKGRNTGWLSYTLSKTDRLFTDLNNGKPFPFKYDRRHNLAINFSHDFTPRKSLSVVFVYTTGMAVNLAAGRFSGFLPGTDFFADNGNASNTYDYYGKYFQNLPDYNGRNSFRAPAYHRLDVSYKAIKPKRQGIRTWQIGAYNIYNRQNPFFLFYDQKQLLQFSLLPIIPSVTYSRSF